MAVLCPICSKVNPSDAVYCYYDGRALTNGSQQGPLKLGTMPFPSPFFFSDGHSCTNFNQLALACEDHWDEARTLLTEGAWSSFLGGIGRMDLATAARQAAKEADLDVGLTHLLEKLPADAEAQRPPRLHVLAEEENLGTLEPGKNHKFEVHIANQGSLVLRGMARTDGEWLCLGELPSRASSKMFQTRSRYDLPVCVLGDKLRAGRQPLEAKIVIETNGGAVTVVVRASVPVKSFPRVQGSEVLAGAMSPREFAVKAKDHVREAATLFEQGVVKAWYASNGWTYPVQGSQATGRGGVQQFFEALGLARPAVLEINTQRVVCKGKPGQRLTKIITLSTKENRFVYAVASSNQAWIKASAGQSQGNTVTVPMQIEVPSCPGQTLTGELLIQGNGRQQFRVPVTLTVAAMPQKVEVVEEAAGRGTPWGWIAAGITVCGLAAVVLAVCGLMMVRNRGSRPNEDKAPPEEIVAQPKVPDKEPPAADGAWWADFPELATAAAVLKKTMPEEDRGLVDDLAAKSDIDRFEPYKRLAFKLPGWQANADLRESLRHLVIGCCVHEPSDLNISHLRRALAKQLPREEQKFEPAEKLAEIDRAFFALDVFLAARGHKAISPKRSKELASDLDKARLGSEKHLAERCYQNIVPTAAASLDHALAARARLLKQYPQHLPGEYRDEIDGRLVMALKDSDLGRAWPDLKPTLQRLLPRPDVTRKMIDLYQNANSEQAQEMETLLAGRFKAVSEAKLSREQKVALIRKELKKSEKSDEERLAELRKLTDATLAALKPGEKKDTALLQDSLRLAHASAMSSILLHRKDFDVGLFDELIVQLPEIEQAEPEEKEPEKARTKAIAVGQRKVFQGTLTEREKVYTVALKASQYTMELVSRDFNAFLRVEGPNGDKAEDDDSGGNNNSRLVFTVPAEGNYRVTVTTKAMQRPARGGRYALTIQEGMGGAAGAGGPGGFFPRPVFRTRYVRGFGGQLIPIQVPVGGVFVPPVGPGGVGQAQQQPGEKKEKEKEKDGNKKWNDSDLDDLTSANSDTRMAAFKALAGNVPSDPARRDAQRIVRYLLVTAKTELDDVLPALESFSECRLVLMNLADGFGADVPQQRAEKVVGGVLKQKLRFARDENWQAACQKMLLQKVLELTPTGTDGADQARNILGALYQYQGLALGIKDDHFLKQTAPSQVLTSIIKHVAGKPGDTRKVSREEGELLQTIERRLQADAFVASNELEHLVLLQRLWIKVLSIHLREQAPDQADAIRKAELALAARDLKSPSVLDQLRAAEETALRMWALAHAK